MKKHLLAVMALSAVLTTASPASAIPIAATDLDVWLPAAGPLFAGPMLDNFDAAAPPPATVGALGSAVYFPDGVIGSLYTYIMQVTPSINNISEFNTGFAVDGFVGIAGWSFSQAAAAGGTGTATDFNIDFEADGTIDFATAFNQALSSGFDSGEVITFFFLSTRPPHTNYYNVIDGEVGTALGFAPVPEPGSIALLGSGLVGLLARRRRKAQR